LNCSIGGIHGINQVNSNIGCSFDLIDVGNDLICLIDANSHLI